MRRLNPFLSGVSPAVSIHAPTRGATPFRCKAVYYSDVSIHAPTRGATLDDILRIDGMRFQSTHPLEVRLSVHVLIFCSIWFQSTHPLEVRQIAAPSFADGLFVSIHAPTRGATFISSTNASSVCSFNPRTHSRCDR